MPNSLPNRKRLTDLAVARMGPGITWDTLLPCFGIRVGARRRTWIVAIDGSKHKVGHFPAIGVAGARAKAREMMEDNPSQTDDVLFQELAAEFLAHGRTRKGRELRRNSLDQYRRVFARYAAPLNRRKVSEIRRRDIAELLRDVASESGATTASLVRSMLRRLWAFAIETGVVEHNEVENTPGYEVPKRPRVLSDSELAALWAATEERSDYHLIVRLLLWTGARRGEAGGMRWSELSGSPNTTQMIWTLPVERSKNHRALELPLARQTVAALWAWPRVVGKDTLFGTISARGFNNWALSKARLDKKLGFNRPFVVHDLRRTVQTRLIGLGVNRDVVNHALNHAMGPIDETYDQHDYATEKQEALRLWADKLEKIVQENKPQVIELPRRAVD